MLAFESFWRRQVYRYDPEIGWWHLPRVYARLSLGGTFHVLQTNAVGMRASRDYSMERVQDRRRVVFLGDSYTAGDGVSNAQRFSDLLEARFPNLDTLNFALNGSGTDQQLLIFESKARHFEADAYVFCICVENIARNMYTCFPSYSFNERLVIYRPKPYFELVDGQLSLRNCPVPVERRAADNLGEWTCTFPYVNNNPDPYAIYGQRDSEHWRLMKAIVSRFVEQVGGKPVLIIPLPMFNHYLEEVQPVYLDRFAELDRPSENVHVIDILPAFTALPRRRRIGLRFHDDPHYTILAHSLVADAIEYNLSRFCPEVLQ